MSYRLIVGLGNPGSEYAKTRHNIGFRVINAFAIKRGASEWSRNRSLKGDLSQTRQEDGSPLYLLKPQTFMNLSGVSIQKASSYYKVPPEAMIVVYDEINLAVGQAKVSVGGGPGGHNGMIDILSRIPPSFTRLRIGVGQKSIREMDLAAHVLGTFSDEEEASINASMDYYIDCLERLIRDGSERAMNHINRKPKIKEREDGQL